MDLNKLKEAKQKFLGADYQNASVLYEDLSKQNLNNPYLQINTGTAFYKLKQYGKAIKCFYSAKKLIPRDRVLNQNLAVISNEIQLKQPSLISTQFLSLPESLILLLLFNILLFLGSRFYPWVRTCIWLGFIFSLIFSSFLIYENFSKRYAVVTNISIPAYSGDSESYIKIFELVDGQIVELVREDQAWSQIEHQGQLGWISRSAYERI